MMGKMELASPEAMPCVAQRLERFAAASPGNADAQYFYAMTLLRSGQDGERVEGLLRAAVKDDPRYAEAYLELGKMAFARHAYAEAIGLYKQAVAADPKQVEAHYRLAVAYDRTGEAKLAEEERRVHDAVERSQADEVERERRRIKQFVVETSASPSR